MDCPLPIDWLDYLEGRESESDLSAHLADCRRCQELVAELREQSVGVELAPYSGGALEDAPRWQEQDRPRVAVGDVWLTKADLASSYADLWRQIVLVVAKREEFDQTWFSVAPLTTETEVATNTDLLLDRDDTTLAIPLALQFRLQTPVAREQLDRYLGETTATGRELVSEALAGSLSGDHFGAPLTRANDRRLRRVSETRELMATLASVYGQALVAAEEAQAANEADDPVAAAAPDFVVKQAARAKEAAGEETAHEGGRLLVFELKRVRPSVPGRLLELAAASVGRSNPLINHFEFASERCTLRARLELTGQMRGEEMLLLFIEHVSGFPSAPAWISFAKPTTGERIESPQFDPTREGQIVLARGAVGISPAEVDQLELRLG
jgi:hypothetical protein